MTASATSAGEPIMPRTRRYYALALITMTAALAMADRQIISILIGPIGAEFHLSDTQLGLIVGAAFSIPYVLAVIPIARLADRGARAPLIGACVFFWSLMTALSGAAQSFIQMALARAGLGLSEAGCSAPAQALVSDLFAPPQRGSALAIFLVGAPLGMGAGLAFGGWALEHYNWRTAFFMAGSAGLVLAPLIAFTLPKTGRAFPTPAPARGGLGEIFLIKSLGPLLAGAALLTLMSAAIAAWTPSFLSRIHAMGDGEIGAGLGAALALGSIFGHLAGGALIDRFASNTPRAALTIALCAAALTGPLGALAFSGARAHVFLLLGLQFFAGGVVSAALAYIMMAIAPPHARATLAALFLCVTTLLGLGVGPIAVGLLSDMLRTLEGEASLRAALLWVTTAAAPASLCLLMAHRTIATDLDRSRSSASTKLQAP